MQVADLMNKVKTSAAKGAAQEVNTQVRQAFTKTIERQKGWWSWELKAQEELNMDLQEKIYQEGLREFPESHELLGCYARFLKNVMKRYDEAEKLYKKILKIKPDDANAIGNYANFVRFVRQDDKRAESLYKKAISKNADHANNMGNFAGFLVAQGKIQEAELHAAKAWALNSTYIQSQRSAEVAFYRGIIAATTGRNDVPALGRLRTLLGIGFLRNPWSFDDVFLGIGEKLPKEKRELYSAVAAAILDEGKAEELENNTSWQSISPISLGDLWPSDETALIVSHAAKESY